MKLSTVMDTIYLPPNVSPRLNGSTCSLSSTSSRGSSLVSRLSSLASATFSKPSSPTPKNPVEFWAQFDRNSMQKRSLSCFLKNIFVTRLKPEVVENIYEFVKGDVGEVETSFIIEEFLADCVSAGLYCVIDDFLSEYELRLIEEEQRAKLIQGK